VTLDVLSACLAEKGKFDGLADETVARSTAFSSKLGRADFLVSKQTDEPFESSDCR
jgi:hypothetical protein